MGTRLPKRGEEVKTARESTTARLGLHYKGTNICVLNINVPMQYSIDFQCGAGISTEKNLLHTQMQQMEKRDLF